MASLTFRIHKRVKCEITPTTTSNVSNSCGSLQKRTSFRGHQQDFSGPFQPRPARLYCSQTFGGQTIPCVEKHNTTRSESRLTGTNFIKPPSVSVNTEFEPQTGSERFPTPVRKRNQQNRDEAVRNLELKKSNKWSEPKLLAGCYRAT